MSLNVMSYVLHRWKHYDPDEFLTMMALAFLADEKGRCEATEQRIADIVNLIIDYCALSKEEQLTLTLLPELESYLQERTGV